LPRGSGCGGAGEGGVGHVGCTTGGQTRGSGGCTACGLGSGAFATSFVVSGAAHAAASTVASKTRAARALDDNGRDAIEEAYVSWVLFEVVLVLAIAIAIVWWTFPKKPRGGRDAEDPGREG